MKLLVISHKRCWSDTSSPSGYSTYGGFPLQMRAIASMFSETVLMLPFIPGGAPEGSIPLSGHNLSVHPLHSPAAGGILRKIGMLWWIPRFARGMWKNISCADAVHTPIPGDIGMIGMIIAVMQRKPLFVRHCGNWLHDESLVRKWIRWFMERYAGGRYAMFATGYADMSPSKKNPAIQWIFSSSVTSEELASFARARTLEHPGEARLIIVCRQDPGKNVDKLILAVAALRSSFPGLSLSVVGDGERLDFNKHVAEKAGVEAAVTFHGKLDHDGVMEQLRIADVFVFPTDSEGFPKSVLEALTHGLPVISTAESVIPYLLSNGSGMLLENKEPESIVQAVTALLNDVSGYARMSECAIERARDYSLERWRDTLHDALSAAWKTPLERRAF